MVNSILKSLFSCKEGYVFIDIEQFKVVLNKFPFLEKYLSNLEYLEFDKLICKLNNIYDIPLFIEDDVVDFRITTNQLSDYINYSYFIFFDKNQNKIYVINNLNLIKDNFLSINLIDRVVFIASKNLLTFLEAKSFDQSNYFAVNHLIEKNPLFSARDIPYRKIVIYIIIIILISSFFIPNIFVILNIILHICQDFVKMLFFSCAYYNWKRFKEKLVNISNLYPVYSILIPLYQEENKILQIINAIEMIRYPKDRLDVKIILELDDIATFNAIKSKKIEDYIQLIKVPHSLPKTKPKALNYAMQYVRGSFVVVYDAEDIPDSNQLLISLLNFRKLPEEYICLQASLNFYNHNENLLTRFFSIEYNILFDYIMPGIERLNLPILLGGTSNHFKTDKLREIGLWDPYNVTEDADLGIRIFYHGYKVSLINSMTMEEAPANFLDWIYQRSRWIKGFIQTILVLSFNRNFYKKFNIFQILTIYFMIGISSYNFLSLPWMVLSQILITSKTILLISNIGFIIYVIFMYIMLLQIFLKDKFFSNKFDFYYLLAGILLPLYFILHIIASHVALIEIYKAPFKWNKTKHRTKSLKDN